MCLSHSASSVPREKVGLVERGGSAGCQRGIPQAVQLGRDHDHDRTRLVPPDDAGRLDSVNTRHVEIEQDEIRSQLRKNPDRLLSRSDSANQAQPARGRDDGGSSTQEDIAVVDHKHLGTQGLYDAAPYLKHGRPGGGRSGRSDPADVCLKCPGRGTDPSMATTTSRLAAKVKQVLTPDEPTKTELYAEARRLGIKGRSKMNKGALKSA